jgi:large subunit ribosomal protein L19
VAAIGDVNRAKLYYLRGKVGRKARVRELRQDGARGVRAAEQPEAAPSEVSDTETPEAVEETTE